MCEGARRAVKLQTSARTVSLCIRLETFKLLWIDMALHGRRAEKGLGEVA